MNEEIGVILRRKNEIMRSGSGVVTSFLKFWEQSKKYMVRVVTNGLKQFLVSLNYSLVGKCPCLPSLGNLGVSVFLLIFLVSLDLLLLYSPTRPVKRTIVVALVTFWSALPVRL